MDYEHQPDFRYYNYHFHKIKINLKNQKVFLKKNKKKTEKQNSFATPVYIQADHV